MERHHRRSIRLKGYDYSQSGAYFVTIDAYHRESLFGTIAEGIMHLNDYGLIVSECWHSITEHFANVILDEFVVMPDHVHGIFFIINAGDETNLKTGRPEESNRSQEPHWSSRPGPKAGSVGSIVGSFKSASANRINKIRGESGVLLWQRNYYEHIIRDGRELNRIREYIHDNPVNWIRNM